MSSLNSLWIKRETIKQISDALTKKDAKGVELTVSISDTGNDYGQNVSAYVSQTKEEREAKKPRFYVGNGQTFWTNGTIQVVKKEETAPATASEEEDDLPF